MKPSRPYHRYTAYHREPGGLRRLDFFVDHIEAWREERAISDIHVLDIGCGNGNIALPIASLGYQVVGVDGNEEAIAQAKRSAQELGNNTAEFRVGWTETVAQEAFDVIIASEVLEHQIDTDDFLSSLTCLLKKDGLLLLSVPNGTSLEENLRRFTTHTALGRAFKRYIRKNIRHETVQSQATHPHQVFFSWKKLTRALEKNNLSFEEVTQASAMFKEFFYLGGRLLLKRGSKVFHFLDVLDARLSAFLPLSLSDGWLIASKTVDCSKPLVLHVLPTLEGGGAERVVHDICAQLPHEGFRVFVVSILRGGPLELDFRKSGIPFRILHVRGVFGWKAIRELIRVMHLRRPAIVHTHLFGADMWGRVAAICAGIRIRISTEHNVNREHGIAKRLLKQVFSMVTTWFIAVSDAVKQSMMIEEGIPKKKISVIRNGIQLAKVIPRPAVAFSTPIRLLVVGRLVEQKGVDVLLRALAQVNESWFLQIAGSGEKETEWKALAETLGLSPRIRWLGQYDDVPALIATSDIFCFPSRWEGLGLSLLEAAAAGLPILASDLPVFHEIIPQDEAEFAISGDVESFVHALHLLMADSKRAVTRAARLRTRIITTCSDARMVKAYASLYRSFL